MNYGEVVTGFGKLFGCWFLMVLGSQFCAFGYDWTWQFCRWFWMTTIEIFDECFRRPTVNKNRIASVLFFLGIIELFLGSFVEQVSYPRSKCATISGRSLFPRPLLFFFASNSSLFIHSHNQKCNQRFHIDNHGTIGYTLVQRGISARMQQFRIRREQSRFQAPSYRAGYGAGFFF